MNLGFEYIKYRWKGKRRHGVHSPFIFDLTDNCLQLNVSNDSKSTINQLISQIKTSNKEIAVEDFGAGSKKMSDKRRIRDILKTSSSKGKYGDLLYKLTQHYQPDKILEFGTSLGIGTIYMKLGNPLTDITTVEACTNTYHEATTHFRSVGIEVNAFNTTFDDYLHNIPKDETFDLIFIDGHHDGKATINYLERLKSHYHNDTLIILDDIRWSDDMYEMWQKLVWSEDFHVTIDLFRMGIITPRVQQHKEHFTIVI